MLLHYIDIKSYLEVFRQFNENFTKKLRFLTEKLLIITEIATICSSPDEGRRPEEGRRIKNHGNFCV